MSSRGATRRTWIKLYVTGMLHGSVRWELSAEERATWVDLLLMAGECNKGGLIADNDGKPLPVQYIANHLNIPVKLLERTLVKCKTQDRIGQTDGVIAIKNWAIYQPDYGKQQAYRERQGLLKDSRRPMPPYEGADLKVYEQMCAEDTAAQRKSDALVQKAIAYHDKGSNG